MSRHPAVERLAELSAGPLDEASERASLLEHVSACAGCRALLAERDPSGLFALLALEPVPPAVAERVSRGVAQALAAERPLRQSTWSGRSWMPLAAALLLAGLLGTLVRDEGALDWQVGPPSAGAASPVGMIQLLSPGTAEVLELSLADAEIVMIFDEGLDL